MIPSTQVEALRQHQKECQQRKEEIALELRRIRRELTVAKALADIKFLFDIAALDGKREVEYDITRQTTDLANLDCPADEELVRTAVKEALDEQGFNVVGSGFNDWQQNGQCKSYITYLVTVKDVKAQQESSNQIVDG